MSDPDVCQKQLDTVNADIERVSAQNKVIDDTKERLQSELQNLNNQVNKKIKNFRQLRLIIEII
jgi:hypothetical protein